MKQDEIVEVLCASASEVFTTMLGIEITSSAPVSEAQAPGPSEGVVSLIGLAGTWVGTGSISCNGDTARKLSGQFLMCEFDAVDEEVLDAIAELTNMIIGSFKTAIEDHLGIMVLSVPTVIFGRNFTTRTLSSHDWTRIPFTCCHGNFDVHLCLARNDQHPQRHPRPHVSQGEPAGV